MRKLTLFTFALAIALIVSSGLANSTGLSTVSEASTVVTSPVSISQTGSTNVVDVTAIGLKFEGTPDEIPAGWTTFRLHNASNMAHFAVINQMPEGKGVEDHQAEVAPVFQEGMDLLNQGETDAAMAKFGELPAWFGDVVYMGGPGFVSPGRTAQMTVYLEPGTYMLECYVKTGGIFHSYNSVPDEYGMVHGFTVTEETTDAQAPEPTLELSISSESGIEAEDTVSPGYHTVAVNFTDQSVYGHFLGHDVQLVRLEQDTDLDTLATWMDWTQPTGLETPAPAEFIGGTQDMPAGETAYFSVLLRPGRYAWIAEVPDPAGKNMLKTFSVSATEDSSG
jgi:hypothetical protein